MTRPLGYSVERPEHAETDAPIALVHSVQCSLCWGSGKLDDGWTIRCPAGCEFTTSSRPVARDVKCKTCSGRWDSDKYAVVKAHQRDCYDCRGTARRWSSSMLSEAEARALRDALTAALGETSEDAFEAAVRARIEELVSDGALYPAADDGEMP